MPILKLMGSATINNPFHLPLINPKILPNFDLLCNQIYLLWGYYPNRHIISFIHALKNRDGILTLPDTNS